ncbi:MAG: sensor histidine kinase [Blautia sp.]|nr:sensor histidine kinase [Blautia sp.]
MIWFNASISMMQAHSSAGEAVSEVVSTLRNMDRSLQKYMYTKTDSYLEDYHSFFTQLQRNKPNLDEHVDRFDSTNAVRNTRAVLEQYIEQYASMPVSELRSATPLALNTMESNLNYVLDSVISSSSRMTTRDMMEDYQAYRKLQVMITITLLVICLVAVILAMNLSRRLTKPIVELTNKMSSLAEGDFHVDKLDIHTNDEIQVIGEKFNEMTDAIDAYVKKINQLSIEQQHSVELRNAAKLMQLKTLQAQISPHFLYNTLNAGAALAMQEEADKTGEFLVQLSRLFRYNLADLSIDTTFQEELQHVDLYMDIVNIRYSGKIQYQKNIQDECRNVTMPRMILQPIVENSILHGLARTSRKPELCISACIEDGVLKIEVYDNGAGMDSKTLAAINSDNASLYRNQSSGLGLSNIINRLQLFYQSDNVISIESEEGSYTRVILTIPMHM